MTLFIWEQGFMERDVLVAAEVAAILRCNVQRIYELRRQGKLPGVIPLGARQYRFSARAIRKLVNAEFSEQEEANEIEKK